MQLSSAQLAYIPSPHDGAVHVGGLVLHMYGLTLLVAISPAIWLTGRRWLAQGGDWDLVLRVAVWGVGFGVVGARAYHDAHLVERGADPEVAGVFEVWQGGLGIWGGMLLGTLAGAVVVRRAGYRVALFMDAPRPGFCSRRASAASATGGTRSCSASRRRCRGA